MFHLMAKQLAYVTSVDLGLFSLCPSHVLQKVVYRNLKSLVLTFHVQPSLSRPFYWDITKGPFVSCHGSAVIQKTSVAVECLGFRRKLYLVARPEALQRWRGRKGIFFSDWPPASPAPALLSDQWCGVAVTPRNSQNRSVRIQIQAVW